MELYSILCGSLDGRGVWGRMDTCICMSESLLFTWNYHNIVNQFSVQFSPVRSLSHVRLFVTPRHQASLSITTSRSLPKLMSIESVTPSNHLILCRLLLLLPSIFTSITVFSNESVLHIRWPKYWSFSFNIRPSNEYSGLIQSHGNVFKMWIPGPDTPQILSKQEMGICICNKSPGWFWYRWS